MHAGRTSAVVLMSGFDNFYSELDTLVKSFKKNDVMIKLEPDLESQIIRIFGEKITALGRAKTGLGDVSELSFATAEHHPYWVLLYHVCQIARVTLEKWESDFTKDDLNEISWSIDELKNSYQKILERPHNDH